MPRRLKRSALHKRSVNQLARSMRARGMHVNPREIRQAARDAMRQTRRATRPDAATQLRDQARVQRAMRGAMVRQLKEHERVRDMEERGLKGRGASKQHAVWQAVGDDRTCESCDERHGEEASMRSWNARGLPGDANLVCDGNCRCELVPLEWVEGEEA